jgi:uncharacterized membrane protein
MKKPVVITVTLALIAFVINVVLELTPPTDSDGGPMMAYNLTYYYPLFIISFIFSISVLLRFRTLAGKPLFKVIVIILILPTILLTSFGVVRYFNTSSEPDLVGFEFHNNTVELIVNDTLSVKIYGYNKVILGENNEEIQVVRVNVVPQINDVSRYMDRGDFEGESGHFKLFYQVLNDTLQCCYSQKGLLKKVTDENDLPIVFKELIPSSSEQSDVNITSFKEFPWKETYMYE